MMPAPVKILQYNVLFANDDTQATPWEQRAAALRAWINHLDPDVITLQEITKGTRADNGETVDMLANILDGSALAHSVFGPACDEVMANVNPGQRGVVLGNAIASRWPITSSEVRTLPTFIEEGVSKTSASQRSAVWARIESPTGPLSVTCTHLTAVAHHGANRADQMAAVLELVKSHQQTAVGAVGIMPSILCGDMNAINQTDEIRYACGHHAHKGHSAPLALHDAWPSANIGRPEEEGHTMRRSAAMATAIGDPRINYCYSRRIDYVLVGTPGLDGAGHVESCEVVGDDRFGGIWPSDHMGVLAQLRAPSAPNHKL